MLRRYNRLSVLQCCPAFFPVYTVAPRFNFVFFLSARTVACYCELPNRFADGQHHCCETWNIALIARQNYAVYIHYIKI